EKLASPQKTFEIKLVSELNYSQGDKYKWELQVPFTEKRGKLNFKGNVSVWATNIKSGDHQIYRTDWITSDSLKTLLAEPEELSPRHEAGGTYGKDVKQRNPLYEYQIKAIVQSPEFGEKVYKD